MHSLRSNSQFGRQTTGTEAVVLRAASCLVVMLACCIAVSAAEPERLRSVSLPEIRMETMRLGSGAAALDGGASAGTSSGAAAIVLEVAAKLGDPDWGIVQSPFMRDNASTVAFRHTVTIDGNRLSYHETTSLEIYGRKFEHTDENELVRS